VYLSTNLTCTLRQGMRLPSAAQLARLVLCGLRQSISMPLRVSTERCIPGRLCAALALMLLMMRKTRLEMSDPVKAAVQWLPLASAVR
jgi:hypothetical protein